MMENKEIENIEKNNVVEPVTVTFEDNTTKQKIIINLKTIGEDIINRKLEWQVTFDPEITNPQNYLGLIGELASFFLASLTNTDQQDNIEPENEQSKQN